MASIFGSLQSFLFGGSSKELPEVPKVNDVPIKIIEVGGTGTEIYGGYISEEYLAELRGVPWADKLDKMRRSDGNVKMCINALKLPLKSSNWFIHPLDDSAEAMLQKKLLEKVIFEDINKSFTKLLGEILTCLEFGYSLFELTFRPKLDDPELGHYNTLKSIAFRSQRTIERWNVDQSGSLLSVTQISNGDLGRLVEMDARFLLHFCPEQEGDNFEGISILRAMYGAWLRKNKFLQLQAVGNEKFAIPTAVLTVPSGKENSNEYANAKLALQKLTSNQSNYITLPEGWTLKFEVVQFEAEKLTKAIDFENREMVNSILASFLLLSQGGGGGSRALSEDLSDFFGQTVQYIADHISEQFHNKVFKPILKMNLGDVPLKVELRCDGLEEKASDTFATTIKTLIDAGAVKKDLALENFLREKYRLPAKDDLTEDQYSQVGAGPQPPTPSPVTLAEGSKEKKSLKSKKDKKIRGLIDDLESDLAEYFESNLRGIGTELINKTLKEKDKLSTNAEYKAAINADIPYPDYYLQGLLLKLSLATVEAVKQVQNQVPKKTKKLSEFRLAQDFSKGLQAKLSKVEAAAEAMVLATEAFIKDPTNPDTIKALREAREEYRTQASDAKKLLDSQELTTAQKQRIQAKAELLIDTQIGDVKKALSLQYQTSLPSTEDDDVIRKDMTERLTQTVGGPITVTGPNILSTQAVNEARFDAAQMPDVAEELESYTFTNEDPVTTVCQELDGRTFAIDDPDLDRYSPPLHYNCKSYFVINMKSFKGNPPITEEPLELSKAAQGDINLSESGCCEHGEKDPHSEALMAMKTRPFQQA